MVVEVRPGLEGVVRRRSLVVGAWVDRVSGCLRLRRLWMVGFESKVVVEVLVGEEGAMN